MGAGRVQKLRDISKVAVIGGGIMGGGVAMSFANAGIPVTILEVERWIEALLSSVATTTSRSDVVQLLRQPVISAWPFSAARRIMRTFRPPT